MTHHPPPPGSWLYVLDCDHGVKIGVAADLTVRIADFARGMGYRPTVFRSWFVDGHARAYEIEQRAHWLLRDCRTVGEWFHCHPVEAAETVERLLRNRAVPIAYFEERGRRHQMGRWAA